MKIAIIGYGKMGKTIEKLALEKGHTIVYKSSQEIEEGDISQADVAIEFSSPKSAANNILSCFEKQIPVICGTTGWLDRLDEIVKACAENDSAFLYASNFSLGVNIFFHINEVLAKLMKDYPSYNVEISEIHHTEKLDAPSGTAISLANQIIAESELETWSLDKKEENKLPIYAFREEDVKGTHTVTYSSDIDDIKISHEAHTRDGFALGAILAAEWILGKKGVFSMKDVLKIQ